QNAAAGVIVDYKGITVAEDTTLRTQCRENNIDYAVVKNTLLRFAFNNVGLNELDDQLNGATSLAVCMDDPVAPARVIAEFAKKLNGKFEIKGGFMDGKVVSLDVAPGTAVKAGDQIMTLEAMKMNTIIYAPSAGTITAFCVSAGDTVQEGQPLAKIG
ncbi:MAG: 50S ribosomal protein L10, partial [Akkermansia sp.]|nr:50S ribosomal protein L10 [Akkermansia sp.]